MLRVVRNPGRTASPPASPSRPGQAGQAGGFTLAEILVVAALLSVLLGAALHLLSGIRRQGGAQDRRTAGWQTWRLAMDQLRADLAQAVEVRHPAAARLELRVAALDARLRPRITSVIWEVRDRAVLQRTEEGIRRAHDLSGVLPPDTPLRLSFRPARPDGTTAPAANPGPGNSSTTSTTR